MTVQNCYQCSREKGTKIFFQNAGKKKKKGRVRSYGKEENRWGTMRIVGVPEEETRIVGTEQSSEETEIKRATEFLEKLMGKNPLARHIVTDFKISEVIIHINTLGEEIRHIQRSKSYFSFIILNTRR